MRLILLFMIFALFGFVQQSCQNETTTGKTEVAKANTNSVTNSQIVTRSGVPAAETAAAHSDDDAARISLADAKKSFDAGEAVFVDTRAESGFKTEHIKGAINIPAEAFQKRYGEVPKNKKIIAYCS